MTLKLTQQEELRLDLENSVTENPDGSFMVEKSVVKAAQAYLKQAPCIEAIKAARREATEGEWVTSPQVGVPDFCHVAQVFVKEGEDILYATATKDEKDATNNVKFAATAANEANKLIAMEDDDE